MILSKSTYWYTWIGNLYGCRNIGNKITSKRIDTLEVCNYVTEGYQLDEVLQNQYSSLYQCGAWRRGTTHQAIAIVPESLHDTRRLVVRDVPPSDSCRGSGCRGAWGPAVRVPRQVVWKCVTPGDLRTAPSDIAEA